jgi:hypothetical protein
MLNSILKQDNPYSNMTKVDAYILDDSGNTNSKFDSKKIKFIVEKVPITKLAYPYHVIARYAILANPPPEMVIKKLREISKVKRFNINSTIKTGPLKGATPLSVYLLTAKNPRNTVEIVKYMDFPIEQIRQQEGNNVVEMVFTWTHRDRLSKGVFNEFLRLGASLKNPRMINILLQSLQSKHPQIYKNRIGKELSKKGKKYVTDWTSRDGYRVVQNARRSNRGLNTLPEKNRIAAQRINRYLAQEMRQTPPHSVYLHGDTTLYRGVHGVLKQKLLDNSTVHEKGYVSFSRDMVTSLGFALRKFYRTGNVNNIGIMLQLDLKDLPYNTPMVWYGSQNNGRGKKNIAPVPRTSMAREQEVLLPPGTLSIVKEVPGSKMQISPTDFLPIRTFVVKYVPDRQAKTFEGKSFFARKRNGKKRKFDLTS